MNEFAQKADEPNASGAIFFAGQYGSTAQYAEWIGTATSLPVFDSARTIADPENFDFLVLGSSVIIHKLLIRKWVKRHLTAIENKPVILFTVSGAPAGSKLDEWIAASLPEGLIARVHHVALRGKLDHGEIGWWVKLILRIGALMNDDPDAREEELKGFDYMDKSSIAPVLELIEKCRSNRSEPDLHEQGAKVTTN
ncbi:MAG: flavodoxin domain-containing protein [Gammaproteobacteria bacterium]